MPKLLFVHPHLTISALQERFRDCNDAAEKTRWQAVLLRAQGRSTAEVAEICGYKPDWVRRLVRRYNRDGPDSLRDGRRNNGKERLLDPAQLEELRAAVLNEVPPGGGLWTGPKVAQWMSAKLGRPVLPQTAWDYLQYMHMSKQSPRPRHVRASAAAQATFKKNSAAVWR
jgi:transposase